MKLKNQSKAEFWITLYSWNQTFCWPVSFKSSNLNIFANNYSNNNVREFCSWFLLIFLSVWPLWYFFIFQADFFNLKKIKREPISFQINLRVLAFNIKLFKNLLYWILQSFFWYFTQTKSYNIFWDFTFLAVSIEFFKGLFLRDVLEFRKN